MTSRVFVDIDGPTDSIMNRSQPSYLRLAGFTNFVRVSSFCALDVVGSGQSGSLNGQQPFGSNSTAFASLQIWNASFQEMVPSQASCTACLT